MNSNVVPDWYEEGWNTLRQLAVYFEVSDKEFFEFWMSLDEQERLYYRTASLS